MARVSTFRIYEVESLYYIYVEKTMGLISCVVSVYAKNMFYHAATHLMSCSGIADNDKFMLVSWMNEPLPDISILSQAGQEAKMYRLYLHILESTWIVHCKKCFYMPNSTPLHVRVYHLIYHTKLYRPVCFVGRKP